LFSECNHNDDVTSSSSSNKGSIHPIITSISHECPLNFRSEPTQLNNSWIEYAQLLAATHYLEKKTKTKSTSTSKIKKKYVNILRLKKKEFKKKKTISEIFSNSNIIIEKENENIPLKSIKNELMEQESLVS
jgi:hypothetical protein